MACVNIRIVPKKTIGYLYAMTESYTFSFYHNNSSFTKIFTNNSIR